MSCTDIRTEVSAVRSDAGGLLQNEKVCWTRLQTSRVPPAIAGWIEAGRGIFVLLAPGTSYDVGRPRSPSRPNPVKPQQHICPPSFRLRP
jgi:hypothetical protein